MAKSVYPASDVNADEGSKSLVASVKVHVDGLRLCHTTLLLKATKVRTG